MLLMEQKLFEVFDKSTNFVLYYEKLIDNTNRYVYFKSYSTILRCLIAPPKRQVGGSNPLTHTNLQKKTDYLICFFC